MATPDTVLDAVAAHLDRLRAMADRLERLKLLGLAAKLRGMADDLEDAATAEPER